jgi:hypothetical protein
MIFLYLLTIQQRVVLYILLRRLYSYRLHQFHMVDRALHAFTLSPFTRQGRFSTVEEIVMALRCLVTV